MYCKIVSCVPKSMANLYVQIKITKLRSSFYSLLVRKRNINNIATILPIPFMFFIVLPDVLMLYIYIYVYTFLNIIRFSLVCFGIFYLWNRTVYTFVSLALFNQHSALEIYSEGWFIQLSCL